MSMRTNSAITAGLICAACCATPSVALGASVIDVLDDSFATPALAFVAGAAAGSALTLGTVGLIALVVRLVRARRRRRESLPVSQVVGALEADETRDKPLAHAPRHMRPAAPATAPVAARTGGRGPKAPVAQAAPSPAPSHAATDYEQIAMNQARSASFRQRMALRAQGVASTLRERMGAGMMDGVPVIERADGTVGDVGTSWWQAAVGSDAISPSSGFAPEEDAFAIPSSFSSFGTGPLVRAVASDTFARAAASTGSASDTFARAAARPEGVSERVAFVEEGAYPERRSVDDQTDDDIWTAALRSLDERIAADAAAFEPVEFSDAVGGIDTLDEPDNLEPSTSFIPFKTPAGHPEVVDTDSYIDYLLADEFEKSTSPAARRSSRHFLRVLQGGTQPASRHLADTEADRPVREAKHFAVAQEA